MVRHVGINKQYSSNPETVFDQDVRQLTGILS